MLEAMACGTTVLAMNITATQDVTNDNEIGFLIQDNLPVRLADDYASALLGHFEHCGQLVSKSRYPGSRRF